MSVRQLFQQISETESEEDAMYLIGQLSHEQLTEVMAWIEDVRDPKHYEANTFTELATERGFVKMLRLCLQNGGSIFPNELYHITGLGVWPRNAVDVLEVLRGHGFGLGYQPKRGHSPLFAAIDLCKPNVVKYLLEHDVDPLSVGFTMGENDHISAILFACYGCSSVLRELLSSALQKYGEATLADFLNSCEDGSGKTALAIAVHRSNPNIVRLLFEFGATLDATSAKQREAIDRDLCSLLSWVQKQSDEGSIELPDHDLVDARQVCALFGF